MRSVIGSTSTRSFRVLFTACFALLLSIAFQMATTAEAKANPKYAAYVIDAKTGKVLFSRNAKAKRYPASLTKMMTLYLMFEDLKSGRISKKTRLTMSKAGARRPPSKIGLRAGRTMSMEQAILALVTKSANDVATAVGDQLSGSEAAFARRMTRKARQLGMNSTTFKNASGLTARGQLTTAADMAKLGLALREHFPEYYRYFQTRQFRFGKRRYGNHNRLLGRVRGVDGIKTGYTRASGFNLVTSASHRGRKIVAVVMGGRSGRSRNAHMRKLVERHLPRASRGSARRLIAAAKPSMPSKSIVKAAKIAAITGRTGAKTASRIASAHAVPAPTVKDVARVRRAMLSMAAPEMPRPSLRNAHTYALANVVTATLATAPNPTLEAAQIKPELAKPEPKASAVAKRLGDEHVPGWQIQIAATDTHKGAVEMLEKVKAKNKSLLKSTDPRAYRVEVGKNTFYRARFTGFESKTAARRACRIIKRQRTACLALNG
ncbi:MAG: D-alanyl-D-alanine carboxypeptidase [Ahrensia sp.]|nr:D-alanyl-D-alanine carboxypeptidase [Ahrensia sp.]